MPNFGVLPFVQSWIQRWESAQAARYAAWTAASTVQAGVMGVVGTAGSMFKAPAGGTAHFAFAAAAGRWAAGPAQGLAFK